jgi:hypothetical protein
MAREHWIENLMCRRCKKDGIAVLSTDNKFSSEVQVRAFRKALGLSSPNMALTFAALHATHQWNSSKACVATNLTGALARRPARQRTDGPR